jgi:glycosyltransferase involved in cell wall biosynthesis
MKLLIISAIWPSRSHSTRAANIVIYEMLRALAKNQSGVEIGLLVVTDGVRNECVDNEIIEELKKSGVDILDNILLEPIPRRNIPERFFSMPNIADKYPQYNHRGKIQELSFTWGADAVLIPWSEWLTHACSDIPLIKFAYYGNPDPKSALAQLALTKKFGKRSTAFCLLQLIKIKIFEFIHINAMKKYEILGNVAKNDANYYTKKGHPNSFYIQNIWIPPIFKNALNFQKKVKEAPIKIIASIGKLGGTANTYGFLYLGKEILPLLEKRLEGINYEVHILGAGKPQDYVLRALDSSRVIWRGYVDDIDSEIANADVFLCVNNATQYKVGHTRYLHAWSLGAPVVAHTDASLSMPEIKHMETALLGSNALEIVNSIALLLEDENLRKKICNGGEQAYLKYFQSDKVASIIIDKLQSVYFKKSIN